MSRLRSGWESLQEKLSQSAETVTRNARIDISGGDVDEIDPPEDIDEFAEQAKQTAIVRANLRQFIQDVTKPGYRLEGPDKTVAYFLGEDDEVDASPPENTPEGGFLENAFIFGGERRQDFYFGLQQTIWERWVRGTVLIELLKQDKESAESPITGFYHIRPETVYPQVYSNTNILIDPDDTDSAGVEITPRGEAAAYIQFDDNSILGLRRNGYDKQSIPLSQNDVIKQTLEPDIGGDDRLEQGIFGESVMSAISEDVAEYNETKRDRAKAIKSKAYPIWNAQFVPSVIERAGNEPPIVSQWEKEDIQATESEIQKMGPGSILTSDAKIDLEQFDSDVPDLDPTLKHYVNDILAALPAPKYATGFGEDITQFVSERQSDSYEDTIDEERQYQERSWTQALKEVARRQGLPTDGLKLKIEPEESDSPVMSLSTDELEKIQMLAQALNEMAGSSGAASLVDREALVTEIAQLPEDVVSDVDIDSILGSGGGGGGSNPFESEESDEPGAEDTGPDPVDQPGENEGDHQDPTEDMDADAMYQDWADIVGLEIDDAEALAKFSEGDEVDTPDGTGVVSEIRTSEFEGPDGETHEPSDDDPVYIVATEDGAGAYSEDELEDGELPEIEDVDNPEKDLEALFDLADAIDSDGAEALGDGRFSWPESWKESDTPARIIALKSWAAMGGRHTGCVREMRGNISRPNAFCADFKDRILGWEGWRKGG